MDVVSHDERIVEMMKSPMLFSSIQTNSKSGLPERSSDDTLHDRGRRKESFSCVQTIVLSSVVEDGSATPLLDSHDEARA